MFSYQNWCSPRISDWEWMEGFRTEDDFIQMLGWSPNTLDTFHVSLTMFRRDKGKPEPLLLQESDSVYYNRTNWKPITPSARLSALAPITDIDKYLANQNKPDNGHWNRVSHPLYMIKTCFSLLFLERRYHFGNTYGDTTRSLEVCAHDKNSFGEFIKGRVGVSQSAAV